MSARSGLAERRPRVLTLALRRKWFDQVRAGIKTEEYRLDNEYWRRRLIGRQFDLLVLTLGYPSRDDHSRRIVLPWRGYTMRTITSEEWAGAPHRVFALALTEPD